MKTLTIYFSMTGTTKDAAENIQKLVGGDLLEIVPLKPYPLGYEAYAEVAKDELDNQRMPEIKNTLPNLTEYDNIFIGFPTWYQEPPMIIHTLLQEEFSGKTIIPFTTSMSTSIDSSTTVIKKIMRHSGAVVKDGFRYKERDFKNQVQKYI